MPGMTEFTSLKLRCNLDAKTLLSQDFIFLHLNCISQNNSVVQTYE